MRIKSNVRYGSHQGLNFAEYQPGHRKILFGNPTHAAGYTLYFPYVQFWYLKMGTPFLDIDVLHDKHFVQTMKFHYVLFPTYTKQPFEANCKLSQPKLPNMYGGTICTGVSSDVLTDYFDGFWNNYFYWPEEIKTLSTWSATDKYPSIAYSLYELCEQISVYFMKFNEDFYLPNSVKPYLGIISDWVEQQHTSRKSYS